MYSLRKSFHILKDAFKCFKRKERKLDANSKAIVTSELKSLSTAILEKNKKEAHKRSKQLQKTMGTLCAKNIFEKGVDLFLALLFALIVATLVRTMWFELYEIPTGSMRPTFKEHDNLIASKTTFGINVPLLPKHFYFDKDLVKHNDIVIFTVENMDVSNPDTVYFFLFPGKRLLIKRLIGKPGDTLYFYGGKIYGLDAQGKPIEPPAYLDKIDHVPFISFDGKVKRGDRAQEYLYYQTGKPLAKVTANSFGGVRATIFNGEKWVPEEAQDLNQPHDKVTTYSDFWGFNNYAMALLLTKEDVEKIGDFKDLPDAKAYLELFHTPNLSYPTPKLIKDEYGRVRPVILPQITIIPLQEQHLDRLMQALYTARFVVKDGRATRYSNEGMLPPSAYDVKLEGIPDGTYEFYYGKAYRILWGGLSIELPKDHPLYQYDVKRVQTLFNLGIDFNTLYQPHKEMLLFPERFAYFRDGALYVMGQSIFEKEDPLLQAFIEKEIERGQQSQGKKQYAPFIDHGKPSEATIRSFGLKIPDHRYFVLGDNYAMSADSRDFGFVPEDNIRGSPSFILWPIGNRMGDVPQPASPWTQLPNVIIWILFLFIMGIWYSFHRKQMKQLHKTIQEL